MPSTIALVKEYYEGADRQRALSFWSIGSWGGTGFVHSLGGAIAQLYGMEMDFHILDYFCYSWYVAY